MDSSSSLQASKVRKPYTITKQRERWTEEEHMKFLEALKLYGRAWRRIEEHIGTKTAVQIRSHAQKFFSKLVKGSSGRGISSDKLEDIEIPPPRPKKKPRHPYPRKATASSVNSNGSQVSKEVNSLPSVVSSAPLLGDGPQQRAGFVPYNSKGRMPNHVNAQDGKLESSNTSSSSLFSLKLFGQTMLVSANEMPPTPSPIPASNASHGAFRKITPQHQGEDSSKSDPEDAVLERSETVNSQGLNLLEKLIANSAVDSGSGPSVGKICKRMDSSEEQVSSDMGTNSSCITRSQGSPSAVSSYPRHVPVQCVVDGNSTKNVSDNSKTCFNISPMPYSVTYNSGSLSNSEAISPWSATIPALFPWVQMQNGENAVAEAVAAATAAAASAWWSLYGALPSFYPQTMFSGIGGMEPPMECRKSSPTNIPETANNADPCDFTSKGFMSSTGKSSMKEADCENERSSNSSNTSSVDVAQDGLVVNAIVNKETRCPKRSHSNSAVSMFEAEESTDLETETEESSMSRKRCRLNEEEVEDEQNSSLKSQVSVNENPKSASNKDLLEFGAQISDENSLSAHEKFADNRIKQNSKKDEGKNNAFCEDEVEAPETPSQKARLSNFSRVNSIENSENKLSQGLVEAVAKSRSGLGFVPYQRCSVESIQRSSGKKCGDHEG